MARIKISIIVFLGRTLHESFISFIEPCIQNLVSYQKGARCSEEKHVNDNQVFVGEEIRHALDSKPHLRHRAQHHDVEQDEHGDLHEVRCRSV